MRFGEKLKNARVGQGMTQETVAKQIGVSRQSLSNWEKRLVFTGFLTRRENLYWLCIMCNHTEIKNTGSEEPVFLRM